MRIVDLFSRASVVATAAVARFVGLSEADARAFADEIGVARIGASFAWTKMDVETLLERLEADDAEQEDDGDEGDDADDPDSDPEPDEDD